MSIRAVSPTLAAWLVTLSVALAAAQSQQARLMGVVTDGSGAALPGVSVTIRGGNLAPISVVTDGAGRYLTVWIAPGVYSLTFVLSGFETRTVSDIPLQAGQTVVLDQQLPLASVTETVQVTGTAPTPPPAPLPPPRPTAAPVDKEILASVCGVRQPPEYSLALARIVGHRDDPGRELMGPGDVLTIDAGEKHGVTKGQNLVVRRRFQTGDLAAPKKQSTFGEQTAGLIQIVETHAESSVALVVYVCGEIFAGDAVERYVAQPAYFAIADGTPRFDDPARITIGEYGQTVAAERQMMVIDRGIMQGVQRGQRLTIFRRPGNNGPSVTIGDGVIVSIRPDSATFRIERSTDAVMVGDLVALHR